MGDLHLTALQVGQRDSIVAWEDDNALVVDVPLPQRMRAALSARRISHVGVALTHAHTDHVPSLDQLVDYLVNLTPGTAVDFVLLPPGYVQAALKHSDPKKQQRNMHAVKKLHDTLGSVVKEGLRKDCFRLGGMVVNVLSPSYLQREQQIALRPSGVNESSLVVQVTFGKASVLLPGDIDAAGIDALLANESGLSATVLKVPHHGAWPGTKLADLFKQVAAPVVLISVGSTNLHKHVRPEVFKELLSLKSSGVVKVFACTEVTACCVHTATERSAGVRLLATRPCAGDIEVVLCSDGSYILPGEAAHRAVVQGVERAACDGRADIQ